MTLGQNFPQRELKSMSDIQYYYGNKATLKQHGCKV